VVPRGDALEGAAWSVGRSVPAYLLAWVDGHELGTCSLVLRTHRTIWSGIDHPRCALQSPVEQGVQHMGSGHPCRIDGWVVVTPLDVMVGVAHCVSDRVEVEH
jgi:hypothetical protein